MITLREVTEKDCIPLAEFLPTGLPFKNTTPETWLRRFDIWWIKNPACLAEIPKGWILEHETKIVGFIGNIPVKFFIRGDIKTAAAAVTWYVDPTVRGLFSIRLFNEFLKQKCADLFLFNTDRSELATILFKNRFKEYILPRSQTEYGYIINRKNVDIILKEFVFLNRLPHLHELSEFFIRLGMVMRAYMLQKPADQGDVLPDQEYTTSLCTFCDDSFFRLWEPHLNACDVTLSRDPDTLNWIYFSSIEPNTRVVIQCRRSRDGSLAGYMVFDIRRKNPSDVAIMHLMDMCFEDKDPRIKASLIAFAIKTGRQYNAALLVVWADSEETETFFQNNFGLIKVFLYHNYIRLSKTLEENSDSLTVCPSYIAPPRGIDHFI
ncbi:MAG: hypothetical protein LUQ36_07525 [Methanoregula sp.]|nr:hypothetical protein [Methanoregula sp.]